MLSSTEITISIIIAVCLGGALAYIFWIQRRQVKKAQANYKPEGSVSSTPLKLQAYERLILLADRIALPNLINRCNQPGLNVHEMQHILLQTVRQEFDHNITQQI